MEVLWLFPCWSIDLVGLLCAEFKNHQLPLARIKKIMKSDEDVKVRFCFNVLTQKKRRGYQGGNMV